MEINGRKIGHDYPPLVIAECGINHGGDFGKAKRMIHEAHDVGCECIKSQCHIVGAEKERRRESKEYWDMMERCSLTVEEDKELKKLTEYLGMIYLSTPFSYEAVDRLERLGVNAYKIGSREAKDPTFVKYVASKGKPIILSTGMSTYEDIFNSAVGIGVPFALLHCVSLYPAPYDKMDLGGMERLHAFTNEVGISDHSIGNYISYAAVALGASIVEKHFTPDKNWEGVDISASIDTKELKELIIGCKAIYDSLHNGD